MSYPEVIQGGMGIGISSWRLAHEIALSGGLGVVSGTGIDAVLIRTLQRGDLGGHYRRALSAFPFSKISQRVLQEYFVEGGVPQDKTYKRLPLPTSHLTKAHQEVIVLANFAEVYLAKEGHQGLVGINLLEKVQMTNLPSLYGAMLAGVDYVIMGAGIPREIPGVLDAFSENKEAFLKLTVAGATSDDNFRLSFSPNELFGNIGCALKRPKFLAVIASTVLAITMVKKATGRVDGFVIEGPTAGGHNAPPRVNGQHNERGEPIYGEKDEVDFDTINKLGLPFWIAGSYADHNRIKMAKSLGAVGVQIGSAFALSEESGLDGDLKSSLLSLCRRSALDVFTDPIASPTNFPFKVAQLKDTLSDPQVYSERKRLCDIGYLRLPYKKKDGTLGYRCAAEPIDQFVEKGGDISSTVGKRCLCNALLANIGLGNRRPDGYFERPLITLGDDAKSAARFESQIRLGYRAQDVLRILMGGEIV